MAVDENAWREGLTGSEKTKPNNPENIANAEKGAIGSQLNYKVIKKESDPTVLILKKETKMEVDEDPKVTRDESDIIPVVSQILASHAEPAQSFDSQPTHVTATGNVTQLGPLNLVGGSLVVNTAPVEAEIVLDMGDEGRHPAIYSERTQLPIFSKINIQNPIHVTPLSSLQTSIQERKIAAMAPAVFFDRKSSGEELFYLYYLSDTGILTRLRGSYSSRRLLDEHSVHFPYSIYQTTIEIPKDVLRMPPSCRILDTSRILYADGVGRLSCYISDPEFPFKWTHMMSFFLPMNSDNICIFSDVLHTMPQRYGLPFVIADARIRDNFIEVALIAPLRRKPESVGKSKDVKIMYTKAYWLTISKKDTDSIFRIVRHRVFECDGVTDYVAFDPNCSHLIFAATEKPKFIYDSYRQGVETRELVHYVPNEYSYSFTQDDESLTIKMELSYFISVNSLNVLFENRKLCVFYRKCTIFRAHLFDDIHPNGCTFSRENFFGNSRAKSNIVIKLAKAKKGKAWTHLLDEETLKTEPTSYYDHHFEENAVEESPPKKAVVSWVLGSSGEVVQFAKVNESVVYGGSTVHQSLCLSHKTDAKLVLFSSDKGYKDYVTIENFTTIRNSIPNIKFTACSPSGRYFVFVDADNKIHLYTWKRQAGTISAELSNDQNVVGEKFVFDLGRYVEGYHDYPEVQKEIVCVLALERVLILVTRSAFYMASDL